MVISVNGEATRIAEPMSLSQLLEQIKIDPRTVAIELSGEVVPRAEFPNTQVNAGDRVEIVRFVQGG